MDPILAPDAPAAVGPYSAAVRAGGFVFCSGQTPLDPATGRLVEGDLADQTRRVFANVTAVLSAAGLTLADVVKSTVFLTTMDDFAAMNAVYAEAFGDHRPARSTVAVAGLPVGARVEIEVIALDRTA
jgi:2-iminobutanoate/2-iminopropanoate deaminase